MAKKKEVLEGTVTWRGEAYTSDWGQSKFKAKIQAGETEEICYFAAEHDGVVRVGATIRFEVSARKYDAVRVYKCAKVEVLTDAPEPEVKEMKLKIGYVSFLKWDDREGGYHCLSKVPKLGWLSIPCRAIEAYERSKPIEEIPSLSQWPFPGNGMGWLTAKIVSNGRHRVTEIVEWEPASKELEWTVPLSMVNFGTGAVIVPVSGNGNGDGDVIIPANVLPFQTHAMFNTLRQEFTGSMTVKAKLYGTGKWNRVEQKQEIIWKIDLSVAPEVSVGRNDLEQFERVTYSFTRERALAVVYGKVRELTSRGVVLLLADVLDALEEAGIQDATEAEAEELLMRPEYDTRFMSVLKAHQDGEQPIRYTDTGLLFTISGNLVYERPMVGAATYIFSGIPTVEVHSLKNVDGMEDLEIDGRDWAAIVVNAFGLANKMDVRYGEVGQLLGCLGFAVHGDPEDTSRWLEQVLSAAKSEQQGWAPPELMLE